MIQRALSLILIVCSLGFAPDALAKNWTVDYSNSHLGFIGTQGSASFTGTFKKFTVTIDFDPEKPETGKITATIDMASASAGSDERDSALPQSDWFDTSKFPQAVFTSTSIRKTGDHAYEAVGNLTIKNITKPVTLPFTLTPDGNHMRAQGKAILIRTDFAVGQGQWSNEAFVKHAVDVTVDIAAQPAS